MDQNGARSVSLPQPVSRDVLLGLDVGTTTCKAMVMDPDGRCRGLGQVATPWRTTATGAEAPARRILAAVVEAASSAIAEAESGGDGPVHVAGIGVTGLAEAGVPLGADAEPLAPVFAWYDERGAELVGDLERDIGVRTFAAVTGLKLSGRPSIIKYRWMVREEDMGGRGVRWLSVPEWVAYELGGAQVTEPSLAGRTGFFDVLGGSPAPELLDWAKAPDHLFADIAIAGEATGRVTPARARDLGVPALAGAVTTVCGHDHLVAGIGVGATRSSDLLDSCGTSEAMVRILDRRIPREQVEDAVMRGISVGRHVGGDRLQVMTGLRSGIGLWRFLKLMGRDTTDLTELDHQALSVRPRSDGPAVEGIWTERAVLTNIGYEPSAAEIWRAAIEAVQRRAVEVKEMLETVAGPTGRIVATGGGLRSVAVQVLKREILGAYVMPDVQEAGARGAAVFAAVAAGVAKRVEDLAPSG
ncbi:FGGY-family carbohydrate kinase [Phytoactinopolyspora halotolerans]|uniref:Carbohydrate kinase n=1 Tax=Phytoactinopolyspora halotolerans TaxID=1981512 RepID=A0A6L9S6Z3_9ACTN|nr:FGGY family carbohydrate kinase [Phytoactinopolyspora halotolerans]NEE00936.1 hypothetical protein [Phytoactinopolyspora halotolerans]